MIILSRLINMYKTLKRKKSRTLKGGDPLKDAKLEELSGETGPMAWIQFLGILGLFGAGIYYTKVTV